MRSFGKLRFGIKKCKRWINSGEHYMKYLLYINSYMQTYIHTFIHTYLFIYVHTLGFIYKGWVYNSKT